MKSYSSSYFNCNVPGVVLHTILKLDSEFIMVYKGWSIQYIHSGLTTWNAYLVSRVLGVICQIRIPKNLLFVLLVIWTSNVRESLWNLVAQAIRRLAQNLFGEVVPYLLTIQTTKLLEISIRFPIIPLAYNGTFAIHCRDCNMVRQWGFNEKDWRRTFDHHSQFRWSWTMSFFKKKENMIPQQWSNPRLLLRVVEWEAPCILWAKPLGINSPIAKSAPILHKPGDKILDHRNLRMMHYSLPRWGLQGCIRGSGDA